ncbi:hypothetical protein HMPREF9554_00481 [Treponema phagedenis F0421]|nr:hypothetical protein HMPREF9554_00481 [Treponema phagedenis F0421]
MNFFLYPIKPVIKRIQEKATALRPDEFNQVQALLQGRDKTKD